MSCAAAHLTSLASMRGMPEPRSRCRSIRPIRTMRMGWHRSCARDGSVHVKSFDSHRARAMLGARTQLVGMTTPLSNQIRGILKTFGMLPGAMRGLPFDRRVEALLLDRADVALIVRPMLVAWRQLRSQIAAFDKGIRVLG